MNGFNGFGLHSPLGPINLNTNKITNYSRSRERKSRLNVERELVSFWSPIWFIVSVKSKSKTSASPPLLINSESQRKRVYSGREKGKGKETAMAGLIYELFTSSALLSLGVYHTICTTRNHLKSPQTYSAKPYHPFPFASNHSRLKHLQLYLLILCLLISFAHQTIISSDSDPLLKGSTPVHHFSSLQSALLSFLFLFLSLSLLLSETTSLLPFPSDLFFALASSLFYLQYSVSSSSASVQTSDLQAKCDTLSSRISALSSLLCLALACSPKLFVADVALGGSLCLQGLWELQTGLTLYVEAFIPEGCHKLLDVVKGVEGSTKCDLEESKLRAMSILDLLFLVHVMFVFIILMATYAAIAKTFSGRRFGSYEALPTTSNDSNSQIQMKALTGTQA